MERETTVPQGKYFLGIDIGGTFTDLVLAEETSHQLHNAKTLTTPDDPVAGVMSGVREVLAQAGASARDIQRVVHATTLATNLILERKGARVGFVTGVISSVLTCGNAIGGDCTAGFLEAEVGSDILISPWN